MAIGLVFLVSIGDVSATSGVIYVNDSSGNDNWDGESDVWDGLTTGPKKTIKNATGTVINGGIVNIADGFYSGENNRNITLDKNMTIIGQSREGTIIDGSDAFLIFIVENGQNVIIQNLTQTRGYSSEGGAIANNGTLTLIDITFADNNVVGGSAIVNAGNMTILNCNFINNTATMLNESVYGYGFIFNYGNLTLNESNFTGNSADYGGAIFNLGYLNMNNCDFENNSAIYGGAVFSYGDLVIHNTRFQGNYAESDYGIGGAIFSSGNLTLNYCDFISNSAISGGAIYNEGNLTINSNNFIDNAVYSSNNTIPCDGGAISTYQGTVLINSSNFSGNTAQSSDVNMAYYGGAISTSGDTIEIINCVFSNNFADGGAAISNGGYLTVRNSNFTENEAACPSEGISFDGAAISNYGNCDIHDSIFTDNYADLGGAISNWADSTLNVYGSTFQRNSASTNGDAIYNEGNLVIHFCQILDNGVEGYYPEDISNFGSADARYNWWGSNQDPSDRVVDCNVSSWLVLRLNPSSGAINNGGVISLMADLLYDVNGVYHNPVNGHVPDGIVVKFSSTLGTIGTTYVAMVNGSAKSSLKGGSTSGVADVAASTANQTVHKSVKIEFIPPKVIYTYPKKYATGVSRTKVLYIKFSESILAGINWSKIVVKNKYGKVVSITKWISGNVLYIKTNSKRSSYSYYTIYIPASAIKDSAGNGLSSGYTIKFKTGRY